MLQYFDPFVNFNHSKILILRKLILTKVDPFETPDPSANADPLSGFQSEFSKLVFPPRMCNAGSTPPFKRICLAPHGFPGKRSHNSHTNLLLEGVVGHCSPAVVGGDHSRRAVLLTRRRLWRGGLGLAGRRPWGSETSLSPCPRGLLPRV